MTRKIEEKSMEQTIAEEVEEIFDTGQMQITMKPEGFSWKTSPSGGDLKHELTIKMSMTTEQRTELEYMLCICWAPELTLTSDVKPKQAEMFEADGFGENNGHDDGKELPD